MKRNALARISIYIYKYGRQVDEGRFLVKRPRCMWWRVAVVARGSSSEYPSPAC